MTLTFVVIVYIVCFYPKKTETTWLTCLYTQFSFKKMTEFQNLAEIKYETPSRTVFENRKIFYGIQKGHSEELQEWFERIQAAIDGCDFGNLSNFLTIDKFISGLSENIFEKFCQTTQLSVEELLTIALSDEQFYKSSFIDTKFETINDIDEFISLDLVKTNDSGVSFLFKKPNINFFH